MPKWWLAAVLLCGACRVGAERTPGDLCWGRSSPPRLDGRLPPIVLVTLDGVVADDVLGPEGAARMPALWRLIGRGVALGRDADVVASGPQFLSLPGYREIL